MTPEKLNELVATNPEAVAEQLRVFEVHVGGGAVSVNVERTLIPVGIAEDELTRWVESNAASAIEGNDTGHNRHAGGTLGDRWTWVYRVVHIDGAVTILNAA